MWVAGVWCVHGLTQPPPQYTSQASTISQTCLPQALTKRQHTRIRHSGLTETPARLHQTSTNASHKSTSHTSCPTAPSQTSLRPLAHTPLTPEPYPNHTPRTAPPYLPPARPHANQSSVRPRTVPSQTKQASTTRHSHRHHTLVIPQTYTSIICTVPPPTHQPPLRSHSHPQSYLRHT